MSNWESLTILRVCALFVNQRQNRKFVSCTCILIGLNKGRFIFKFNVLILLFGKYNNDSIWTKTNHYEKYIFLGSESKCWNSWVQWKSSPNLIPLTLRTMCFDCITKQRSSSFLHHASLLLETHILEIQ